MEQQHKQDNRPTVKNYMVRVCLHIAAIGYAVYMFYVILRRYLAGGEGAPNLATLILGGIILLGGSVFVGVMSWRLYRQTKQEQDET